MSKYYCPMCGTELEQGQYEFDPNTGNLHVVHCPNCYDSEGMVVHDEEQADRKAKEDAAKKYVEDNIEDFDLRYDLALNAENRMRCSLEHADPSLYSEITDRFNEWCEENDYYEIDLDDIF